MPSKRKPLKTKLNSAGYSNRRLADKLGLKHDTAKAILEAPEGFAALIGTSDFDTSLDQDKYDFIHFFASAEIALRNIFPVVMKRLKPNGMLWISWPKKSSGIETDLTENIVRETGLANGLVDVKICAIDATWSGLKFMYRLKDRR
jgi:hypothetical protein